MASSGGIRAGAAFVELYLNDNRMVRGLKRAQAKLRAFGAAVRATGMRMMAMGGAIAAPLLLAAKHFASAGDTIQKMSARTGMSAKALSELGFAAERSGTNLKTLEKGGRRMQRNIVDAGRGLSTAVDAFGMLGLSVDDLNGLSPEKQFELIADRISKIEDPTKRAALAQMIFGRAGAELIPLLNEGAAGMAKLRKKAQELGITMSQDDANAAAKLTDAMSDVWAAAKAGAFHIGAALADALTEAAVKMSELVARASAWVRENQGLIVSIAKLAGILFAAGAALIMVGIVFGSMASAIGGVIGIFTLVGTVVVKLAGLLAFLLSPIGLVTAGIIGLAAVLLTSTKMGEDALSWLGDAFNELKSDALTAWSGISDALAAGDIALAAKVLWLTLKMEWQKGVHALNGLWIGVKETFVSTWTSAVFGVAKIATKGWAMLSKGWEHTVGFLADVWHMFSTSVMQGWTSTVAFIQVAWEKLKGAVTGTDTSAAQKRILDKANSENDAREDRFLKGVGERDKRRRARLKEIEDSESDAVGELNAEQKRRRDARKKRNTAALAATRGDLDAARAARDKSVADAKAKREAKEQEDAALAAVNSFLDEPSETPEQRIARLKDVAGAGLSALTSATEVKGTFSAHAVRGMQTGGPMERIAKATESTAASSEETAENTGNLALPTF